MSAFQAWKTWVVVLTGLPKDALHIYVGLIVFLAAAALLRRSLGDWRPLAAVLLVALAGEAWDMADSRRAREPLEWARGWHDLWNTMFWPLVLHALARWSRVLKR